MEKQARVTHHYALLNRYRLPERQGFVCSLATLLSIIALNGKLCKRVFMLHTHTHTQCAEEVFSRVYIQKLEISDCNKKSPLIACLALKLIYNAA